MKIWRMWIILVLLAMVLPLRAQEEIRAETLLDDFDSGYEENGLAGQWWTYSDDSGSSFGIALDSESVYNGIAAMQMDFEVAAGGFAGTGFDFSFVRDWREGDGILLRLRASEAGLPLNIALHIQDETQTSTLSPGVTPFACLFTTPEGSESDWVTVNLPWSCFRRLFWVGEEGITEFVPNPILAFEFAYESADSQPFGGSIWVDDLRVISDMNLDEPPTADDFLAAIPVLQASQTGYRPQDAKWFISTVAADAFSVLDSASSEEVFSGSLEAIGFDEDTQQELYRGDFDALDMAGTYLIRLASGEETYPFEIGETVYALPLRLAARALYLQRSGITIRDAAISGVDIEAGHLEAALRWDEPEAEPLDVSGGWYDAGDFGRYIPTAAFAVNQLLYAFNANPEAFADGTLDLPESGNGLPDLLDEIRWETDWLLKMQREDGAVYHKVTTRSFPGFGTLPAEDTAQMYVFGISSADTAYFAAVMAQAAQTFQAYDADYAATLLDAAVRAGDWLETHPEQVPAGGFQNPPVSEYPMQGGYDFVGREDVPRLWAAAELFRATGETRYQETFAHHFAAAPRQGNHSMNWANVYPMGLYAYLNAENGSEELRAEVAEVFQAQAAAIYEVTTQTGYDVALTDSVPGFEFVWGSNQVALAHGLYLRLADELFPNDAFEQAALAQIQFVLGINPLAKSYLSGIGADPVLYPHHNLSYRMKQAVPGFVTEGSNSQGSGGDATLEGLWEMGLPSAMRYIDDWDSWASNEPTIDANATFVGLLAYVIR